MTIDVTTATVASEIYRGHLLELVNRFYPGDPEGTAGYPASVRIDGRTVRRPKGTNEVVMAKLRKFVDIDIEDAELLPRLTALIANATAEQMARMMTTSEHAVGDVRWVYAMGQRRQGLVTKIGRTNIEVAYTTASSGSRVFRKTISRHQALVEPIQHGGNASTYRALADVAARLFSAGGPH